MFYAIITNQSAEILIITIACKYNGAFIMQLIFVAKNTTNKKKSLFNL